MNPTVSVRPFRLFSWSDYRQLSGMMEQADIKEWMENVKPLTLFGYWEWIWHNNTSLLYALEVDSQIAGFVYFYSDPGLKDRLQRLGMNSHNPVLEISFAKKQHIKYQAHELMQSGVTQAIQELYSFYLNRSLLRPEVIAFIDPQNEKAKRLITNTGFEIIGEVVYNSQDTKPNLAYRINKKSLTY
jgi:RimJ/RimL family protein N-acetyltransferase